MKLLNSIILEGDATGKPLATGDEHLITVFTLNHREEYYRVKSLGRLGQTCVEVLDAGRGMRIVGSIHVDDNGPYILAEHVEFKPEGRVKE